MMDETQIRFEVKMEAIYKEFTFAEKAFLARKLIKEGFIKEAPLLRSWWMQERIAWTYPLMIKAAMDEYVDTHPEILYLEHFEPEKLTRYNRIGLTKIQELRRRKNQYLKKFNDDNK